MSKLLETTVAPDGRVEKWWLHPGDDGKDRITVETIQDVEPILDQNKREYNDAKPTWNGAFHKVATIPNTVIEEICRVKGISYSELMLMKTDRARQVWLTIMNDPEFLFFRTKPGRIAL